MTDDDDKITFFMCGTPTDHRCDYDGPEVPLRNIDRDGNEHVSGSSATCSVCGVSAFDASWWLDDDGYVFLRGVAALDDDGGSDEG